MRYAFAALAALTSAACEHAPLPEVDSAVLPQFDSAYVCAYHAHNYYDPPPVLQIDRDCTAIDPAAFRSLALSAKAEGVFWKGGFVAVGRSLEHGDQYFNISYYGAFYTRPGLTGVSYVLPEESRQLWADAVERPFQQLLARRSVGATGPDQP